MSLAKNFLNAWLSVCSDRESEINTIWDNNKEYTKLVISSDNSIVVDVAKRLELECFNGDYYYIDSVFYKNSDLIPGISQGCYLKDIRIAFEHENNFSSGLFQEVSHLLQTKCNLKVLVSYPDSIEKEKNELDYLHSIINSSENSDFASGKEEFLILFNLGVPGVWKGWLYTENNWQLIEKNC
jgi:hypothetical protein